MRFLRRAGSILDWILHRSRAEQRLDDELRSFIAMSAAEKIRDGVPPAEARRQAMIELGGLEPVKESVRRYRYGGALDEVARDVRYAWRMFFRAPAFTLIIVVTLALGIGANTAIFSLVHALMLRWLPVKDPQELVLIVHKPARPDESPGTSFSYAIARAFARQTSIFSGAAGFSGFSFDVGSGTSIRQVPGAIVTGGFYDTLGLVPVAGRPAIEYLFEWLAGAGIQRTVLALGLNNEDLAAAYPPGRHFGMEFTEVLERQRLESGGAIRNAVEIMHMAGDDPQAFGRVRDLVERQVQELARVVDDLADIADLVQRTSEQKEVRPPAGPTPGRNQRRVLVVDDNPDQLESLGLLFELMGHEVCLTATGPDALTVIASFKPDVAIVDIGLPGMSGYDVARALRADPATAGVILVAVSGYAQEEDRRRAREAGFDSLLAKPADTEELIRLFSLPAV